LAILGDPELEEKVVQKYLRMARPRFKQLIISIETLLDTSTLSVEEITGRLKSAEDDPETPSGQSSGKLYLTEEEWIERYKKKEQGGGRGGSNSGGRSKRGRGRWRGRGGRSTEGSGGGSSRNNDKCRSCGKMGHWAYECKSKPRKEEQAHVTQDNEQSLLFLEVASEPVPALSEPGENLVARKQLGDATVNEKEAMPTSRAKNSRMVHLAEGKVFAALG
jgi:hypothetical protein